jgi:phage gp36-like protein
MPTVPFADRDLFYSRYPDMEVVQLSDLDDPARMTVRPDKLQANLVKATNRICAKVRMMPPESLADIPKWHPSFPEWCCDIARDYLDEGYGYREGVQRAGEQAWAEIESLVKDGSIEFLIPPNYGNPDDGGDVVKGRALMSLRIV